jgi:acetyl-CoA carboxylase biotin carboxyl carrier protein
MADAKSPRRDGAHDDHAAIRRLADELLPALMSRLEASALGELEVSQDGWRVRLRKPAEERGDRPALTAGRTAGPVKAVERDVTSRSGPRRDRPADTETRRVVASPAVGVFQPPDGTTLGRQVRAGDVVGRVDVLGVPQEVVAPFDGVLGRMLVEPGEIVEYGEPLMRIEQATRSGAGGAESPAPEPR